jgi:hypothetical protein
MVRWNSTQIRHTKVMKGIGINSHTAVLFQSSAPSIDKPPSTGSSNCIFTHTRRSAFCFTSATPNFDQGKAASVTGDEDKEADSPLQPTKKLTRDISRMSAIMRPRTSWISFRLAPDYHSVLFVIRIHLFISIP